MNEKLQILNNVLGTSLPSGQEHLFLCPFCGHHKHKFSINIEKNMYKCWVCDERGKSLYRLVRKYGTYDQIQKWKALSGKVEINDFEDIFKEEQPIAEEEIGLPQEFITLTGKSIPKTGIRAMNYLKKRGINE